MPFDFRDLRHGENHLKIKMRTVRKTDLFIITIMILVISVFLFWRPLFNSYDAAFFLFLKGRGMIPDRCSFLWTLSSWASFKFIMKTTAFLPKLREKEWKNIYEKRKALLLISCTIISITDCYFSVLFESNDAEPVFRSFVLVYSQSSQICKSWESSSL